MKFCLMSSWCRMNRLTMSCNTVLIAPLLFTIVWQSGDATPADPRSLISGLFKTRLGDLYNLRDALQGSTEDQAEPKSTSNFEQDNFKMFPQDNSGSDSVFQSLSELIGDEGIDEKDDAVVPPVIPLSKDTYETLDKNFPRPGAYQYAEEDMVDRLVPSSVDKSTNAPEQPDPFLTGNWNQGNDDIVRGDYFANDLTNLTDVRRGEDGEVPQEYWTRVKGIVGNMKSILEQMYPPQNDDERRTFSLFDKAISFGDNINVVNKIGKTFDNELLGFLGQKWTNIKENFVNGSPVLKFILSMNTKHMTKNFMMALIQQLGHLLHQQAFTHLSEMDFVTELMRSSGFKDFEIQQVFQLLDLPTDTIDNEIGELEGRQLGAYSGYNIEKSGGYGHSGGGGYGGGGGGYMQSFDPFVLLAGLAFATFLAYLLYRLLSSTTGRKRDIPDISLALDLSDLPDVVGNIYSWLEKTEEKYGGDEYHGDLINDVVDESESFGSAANQLWSSFQADRFSHSCVKRYLCDYAGKTSKKMMGHGTILEQLALTSLAQLFGEEEGAKMIDHVQSAYMDGKEATCSAKAEECDDITYESVVTTSSPANSSSDNTPSSSSTLGSSTEWTATISPETAPSNLPK